MATQGPITTVEMRHRLLRCMQCGTAVGPVGTSLDSHCQRCGCDWSARPPRSYAQLEGLYDDIIIPAPLPDASAQARMDAAATRWVLTLMGVVVVASAVVALMMLLAL